VGSEVPVDTCDEVVVVALEVKILLMEVSGLGELFLL
jgi:hypothetical protein